MEYYVLPSKAEADAFLASAINGNGLLPINEASGYKMLKWAEESREMLDGRGAIPGIPAELLEHHGVGEPAQKGFRQALAAEGGTIEELTHDDFPVIEPEF